MPECSGIRSFGPETRVMRLHGVTTMAKFKEFFKEQPTAIHPLLRALDRHYKAKEISYARIEIRRPRATLGFETPTLYLHLIGIDGRELPT